MKAGRRRVLRSESVVCAGVRDHVVVYEKAGYPIARCEGCGLGSTVTLPGFRCEPVYGEGYFSGGREDGYADYAGSEAVLRKEFGRTVQALRQHGTRGGRLLEIGCAYGFFLMEAERYFECRGIDVSEAAVASCRKRGLHVDRCALDAAWLGSQEKFDAA